MTVRMNRCILLIACFYEIKHSAAGLDHPRTRGCIQNTGWSSCKSGQKASFGWSIFSEAECAWCQSFLSFTCGDWNSVGNRIQEEFNTRLGLSMLGCDRRREVPFLHSLKIGFLQSWSMTHNCESIEKWQCQIIKVFKSFCLETVDICNLPFTNVSSSNCIEDPRYTIVGMEATYKCQGRGDISEASIGRVDTSAHSVERDGTSTVLTRTVTGSIVSTRRADTSVASTKRVDTSVSPTGVGSAAAPGGIIDLPVGSTESLQNPAVQVKAYRSEFVDFLQYQGLAEAIEKPAVATAMFRNISNVLNDEMGDTKDDIGGRLLELIDRFTANVVIPNGTDTVVIVTMNVIVKAIDLNYENMNTSLNFRPESEHDGNGETVDKWEDVWLTLPKEVFSQFEHSSESVRIQLVAFWNSKVFKDNDNKTTDVGPVIAASVLGHTLRNLTKPVIIHFPVNASGERRPKCVYWDHAINKTWSTGGMTTIYNMTHENKTVTCEANHLTNFAVLMEPHPGVEFTKTHNVALAIISYVGCAVSVLGLTLTMITYIIFPCLHSGKAGKIVMNLCSSMLLMNVSFLLQAGVTKLPCLCDVVAVCLHYFTLTSLLWMGVEAAHMYQVLIRIFNYSGRGFMIKRCILAWGVPALIVGITLAVDTDNYKSKDDLCRLNYDNPYAYYIGFLGPCCLILFTNCVIFIMLIRVILRPKVKTFKGHYAAESNITASQIRGAISVMVLLGVTWVFGAFAVDKAKLAFTYIFCMANSMQGFLIFMFRCLCFPEARMAWNQLVQQGTIKRQPGVRVKSAVVSFRSSTSFTSWRKRSGQYNINSKKFESSNAKKEMVTIETQ